MNTEETYTWVEQLLPAAPSLERIKIGESFPEFAVAQVFLGLDATDAQPETVAMTVDAGRIEAGLEAEPGTEVRVEFVTVVTDHGTLAAELVAATATRISQDPVSFTPQPGTVLRGVADNVNRGLSARNGLLIVPFLWEKGVPQVHELSGGGGKRAVKEADQADAEGRSSSGEEFDYTHPGRLTVPAQLVMITDEELAILERAAESGDNGVDALQDYLSANAVNINDVWR